MVDAPTEFDLVVGSLITAHPEEDPEAFADEAARVAHTQELLREAGVVFDLLAQPGSDVWQGGIETQGALYQLSRMAAHLERGDDIQRIIDDGPVLYEDEPDPAVVAILDEQVSTRYAHLVNLISYSSYYLPVAFAKPLWLPFEQPGGEEEDAYFASAVTLLRELTDLREQLVAAGVAPQAEAFRCLEALHMGASQSIAHNLPLIIW